MSIEDKIKNVELLTNIFGRFPTFHDAEVVQIVLDRGDWKNIPPTLLAKIHALKLVSKDQGNGNYLWSHHLVELRFSDVEDLNLGGWNLQNVLADLYVKEISVPPSSEMKFTVMFESCFGLWAEFKCSEITVESVGSAQLRKKEPVDEKIKQERQRLVEEHLRRKRGYES